ncbi:MAG: rhodanese-like domain-containing protein [Oligoflexia bacterium]|nr:rhodanese-like domain-containing protein [Oligoflexia bacterium]
MRAKIYDHLYPLGIKGTILVASEGVNGFIAGSTEVVKNAFSFIQGIPGFETIKSKEAPVEKNPYSRFFVKHKKEIVTFKIDGVPSTDAPRMSPKELSDLIDSNEDFILLDTRNDYEFELGTFKKAQQLNIQHFVQFPDAIREKTKDWKSKKIVTFCTGGIRCEKAAPYLIQEGFENVYQLEGGILGYFQAEGGKNWDGECFVFDGRVAVSPDLKPSGAWICQSCHEALSKSYSHCPYCKTEK